MDRIEFYKKAVNKFITARNDSVLVYGGGNNDSSSLHFDIMATILIYIMKLFYKVKRFFGNIKKYLKR